MLSVGMLRLQKHITIYETLKRIGDAEQRNLDTWAISLTSGEPSIQLLGSHFKLKSLPFLHLLQNPPIPVALCQPLESLLHKSSTWRVQARATSSRSCPTPWRPWTSAMRSLRPPRMLARCMSKPPTGSCLRGSDMPGSD